jgi:cytosine/uracil/thiamine/allantoin permease
MSLELLLVLSVLLLAVGTFAAVKRRAVLAAVTLPLGLLGLIVWALEKSGIINV